MGENTPNILPFGQKIQIGNFTVLKFNKTLTKNQLKAIRADKDIPAEIQKQLTRAGLPYIKVEAVSGIWAIEFCCNTAMFAVIDRLLPIAIVADAEKRQVQTTVADFAHLFNIWFTDTTVKGDPQYMEDKGNALAALIARQKAKKEETPEEKAADDKITEEVKQEEEAKANIIDMANRVNEEGKGGKDGE